MSVTALSWVWKRSVSSGNDRLVLLAIADDADGNGENAWPLEETIADDCVLSVRTVQRCIVALQGIGELRVELNAGGSERHRSLHPDKCPNRYTILLADKPDREPGTRPEPYTRVTTRSELGELPREPPSGVTDCHPAVEIQNPRRVSSESGQADHPAGTGRAHGGVTDCHPGVIHRGDSVVTPLRSRGVTAQTERGDSPGASGVTAQAERGDRAVSPRTREELEIEQLRTSSAPATADALTDLAASRGGFFEQLVSMFGPASTQSRQSFYGSVVSELLELDPVPSCADVRFRAGRCLELYPEASPGALVKHWDALAGAPPGLASTGNPFGLTVIDGGCTVGNPDCDGTGLIETDTGLLRCDCLRHPARRES